MINLVVEFRRTILLGNIVKEVPIWEKSNLTVEEAAAYTGIGINKIREMSSGDNCPFVLWVGNKRLIKRRKFDEYVEKQFSI
ncbi:MAG: excisionase family DNA-binding protein [Lachnospiraceae bacterium]|jgi:excisionase family DNA binding protein|nr:excisionase family DNA-binding protein [Lachnospiraceae bacterium]